MNEVRRIVEPCWDAWRAITNALRGAPEPEPITYDIMVNQSRAIFGDPAQCREHLKVIQEKTGVDRVALHFHFGGLAQDRVLASMRLFAAEVAPAFGD